MLGRPAQTRLFHTAARFHPVLWKIVTIWGTFLLFCFALADVMALEIAMLLAVPVAYWLAMGTFLTPVPTIPSVVVELRASRILSIHMERKMPSELERDALASAIVELARKLGIAQLEMRSALFGDERKANLWLLAMTTTMHKACPDASVVIADRMPLSSLMSQRYLCTHDQGRGRARVVDGRVTAARITVSNIGSSRHIVAAIV